MVHWYAVPPSHSECPGFDYRPSTIVYIWITFFFIALYIFPFSSFPSTLLAFLFYSFPFSSAFPQSFSFFPIPLLSILLPPIFFPSPSQSSSLHHSFPSTFPSLFSCSLFSFGFPQSSPSLTHPPFFSYSCSPLSFPFLLFLYLPFIPIPSLLLRPSLYFASPCSPLSLPS